MMFLGKWTLTQGGHVVQIDLSSGVLSVGAPPSDQSEKFNAYSTTNAFVLQAANGWYVVATNGGYAATKSATDPLNQFRLENDRPGARILDLGVNGRGPAQDYWNNISGRLSWLAKASSPPATTLFTQTIVTPGLATILEQGFATPQPDLTWVDVSGTDFSKAQANLDFTQTTLLHADLSNTTFQPGTAFDGSRAAHAKFCGAILVDCSIGGGADCTHTDFSDAQLVRIEADSADFSHATLTRTNFNQAINLAHAKFIKAKAQGADFRNTGNILDTNFAGADLTNAKLTRIVGYRNNDDHRRRPDRRGTEQSERKSDDYPRNLDRA